MSNINVWFFETTSSKKQKYWEYINTIQFTVPERIDMFTPLITEGLFLCRRIFVPTTGMIWSGPNKYSNYYDRPVLFVN